MGVEVQVARGLHELAPADLVLPHIDLTVTPRAYRKAWGMDFGKIDFVMHDGKAVILGINRTPADLPPAARLVACRPYGPGSLSLLKRVSFTHIDVDA